MSIDNERIPRRRSRTTMTLPLVDHDVHKPSSHDGSSSNYNKNNKNNHKTVGSNKRAFLVSVVATFVVWTVLLQWPALQLSPSEEASALHSNDDHDDLAMKKNKNPPPVVMMAPTTEQPPPEAQSFLSSSDSRLPAPAEVTDVTNNNTPGSFVCPATAQARLHKPIAILANARVGSNLFFNFVELIGDKYADTEVISLVEGFTEDPRVQVMFLTKVIDHLQANCHFAERGHYSDRVQQFQTPEDLFADLRIHQTSQSSAVYDAMIAAFDQRFDQPLGWLRFVTHIPSYADHAYVAFKIFRNQLGFLHMSASELIDGLVSESADTKPLFLVLWRRNILEIYVSFLIAVQKKQWMGAATTQDDAVELKQSDLKEYVASIQNHYRAIRDHLRSNNIAFEQFEYDRNLREPADQLETVQALQKLLGHPSVSEPAHVAVAEEIMGDLWAQKQSNLPVRQEIKNWDQVQAWGYSDQTEDWEDLFADAPTPGFVCSATDQARLHQPIAILANARVGSNLFFNFVELIGDKYADTEVISLVEGFSEDPRVQVWFLSRVIDHLQANCHFEERGNYSDQAKQYETPEDLFADLRIHQTSQSTAVYDAMIAAFDQRFDQPLEWLRFVTHIPSYADHAYVVFKIFKNQLGFLHMSASELIDGMVSESADTKPLFWVLWRRNILEIYVSFLIAVQKKQWMDAATTQDDAVELKQSDLKEYVASIQNHYRDIRDHLRSNNIAFEQFEYDRNLRRPEEQFATVQALQKLLGHPSVSEPSHLAVANEVMGDLWAKKQSNLSARQEIKNWDQVQAWGYSDQTKDWEDLFAER